MDKLVVNGGTPLRGDVVVSGSKNAAVAILPAVLLSENPCVIENVPHVIDVDIILNILTELGASCSWKSTNTVYIDATGVKSYVASHEKIGRLRGSYYFIGALLGRCGHAEVALPGGCNLGPRPIDQHLKGFQALGAEIEDSYGMVKAHTAQGKLRGSNIYLDIVSVGATINLMLAACRAEGLTVIENCAREPHVVDVANFLNFLGANIKGAGTDTIRIRGVQEMRAMAEYSVIPDQIEAGTFMIAAAATKGDVTVRNLIPRHQESLTAKLQEMNVGVEEGEDWIRIFDKGPTRGVKVKTLPYPGFPTDMQPQITTLLSLASGESTVTEAVWDSRFQYVDELRRLGADIKINGRVASICGDRHFKGASVHCPDLRAGAALVIAALAAEGRTDIYDIKYIDRGYDHLEEKLALLGANIVRKEIVDDHL